MLPSLFTIVLCSSAATAAVLDARGQCFEGTSRICYGKPDGVSQNLNVDDVQYVADYLRYISEQNSGAAKFWNMGKGFECPEWGLPVEGAGSVLALAKHNNPRTNSSILYEDIANAIDGGANTPADKKSDFLIGCGTNGGQVLVKANLNNPLYSTPEYKASGAKPQDIILKLVKSPSA